MQSFESEHNITAAPRPRRYPSPLQMLRAIAARATEVLPLQDPAGAVGTVQEALGIGLVGNPELNAVPLQWLARANRDVSKQHGFRQRTGVIEVVQRQRRIVVKAGTHPFLMMADGAGDFLSRRLVVPELLFGIQPPLRVVREKH